MPKINLPKLSPARREGSILLLFAVLTVVMLYPLSTHLVRMVPEPTDPLLNVWRMQWNARAFLGGAENLANIFDTNIFFPFPLTLAYSEHFLMMTAQALPFLLITDNHLVGMNLSVLLTFVLSGYAMVLLVTDWTGNRWAGLIAGVVFAYSPNRFGQLNHLELLVTQWMPLALLALHWTLTRRGFRYPALFIIFFNLQALSGFHYTLNLTLACGLLALIYALTHRIDWRRGLWLAGGLSVGITLLINWPVWRMYLRFSDVMGAIRTPGEVHVYSAAITDYFTSLPHNLLYGWTFGRWTIEGHQFQPLMPVGLIGLLLALVGVSVLFRRSNGQQKNQVTPLQTSYALPTALFFFILTLTGLLLSFGLNEEALGPSLSPLLEFSPYKWLYETVPIFQGIRVPGRYSVMVVLGLSGLAGWGAAQLLNLKALRTSTAAPRWALIGSSLLMALIIVEYWSVPLEGPQFLAGPDIPPVYAWLETETAPDAVVLELPFRESSEFLYEYYSSYHWRRLANGGTGFTPPIYKEMRHWFNAFPDARSVDVMRQLGINYVILHPRLYAPEEWERLMNDLPRYLPAIKQVNQIGDDLVLQVAPPTCHPAPRQLFATLGTALLDGLPHAAKITYHNQGPAAYVAEVQQVSHLIFTDGDTKDFTEPLVTPANESQSVLVPLKNEQHQANLCGAWLASLDHTISLDSSLPAPITDIKNIPWQPLGLQFQDGTRLAAVGLNPQNAATCGRLTIGLQWEGGQSGDSATVQLLDPFGRIVIEDTAQPWDDDRRPDVRALSLVGSLPPGQYGLRILLHSSDGAERHPITEEGVPIPANQIPPLPVVIHSQPDHMLSTSLPKPAVFGEAIALTGVDLPQTTVSAGDWLRFNLIWQAEQPVETNLTVFTQLIGPNGRVWGQQDNEPGGGWYQTSLWLPGQPIIDAYAFRVQPDAPPGVYRLIAGLYHSEIQQRIPLQNGQDFVEVGMVEVEKRIRESASQ